MTILKTMASSLTSKCINDNNQLSNNPFEDFVRSRGRSGRAGSLALPNNSLLDLYDKEQEQCNSLALLPPNSNIRRHSSHYCPPMMEDKPLVPEFKAQQTTIPPIIPPPVPKRTFKGKLTSQHQLNEGAFSDTQHPDINRETTLQTYSLTSVGKGYNMRDIPDISTQYVDIAGEQNSDDDRMSLENSVFEEPRADLCIMNTSRQSNRSSSDSNKSQATADTGYVSNENEKMYTQDGRNYRSRFSSVDTQSSLDSCLTEKTIDSPLSKDSFKMESGISLQGDINTGGGRQIRALPAVPVRRQISVPPRIPPPTHNTPPKMRPTPPAPPLRSQHSLDSGKFQFPTTIPQISSSGKRLSNMGQSSENNREVYIKPIAIRPKIGKGNKPPPITHPKLHQRQDSSLSSDSFSLTSSPGYNCKSMEAPLIQHASKINSSVIRHQDSSDSFVMTPRYNLPSKVNCRQDSTISSDSFSQTSSPGYTTKIMEAPLLPHTAKMCNTKQSFKVPDEILKESDQNCSTSPITKSASTPASLQTIVRFQNGSNMSLQHRIINRRKSSNPYVTQGRLRFRLFQILLNAVVLLLLAAGLAIYFNAYPPVTMINKTMIGSTNILTGPDETPMEQQAGKNPAPGVCLPVIVKFCQNHQLPYNFTVFPNYIGHFGQPEAQVELEAYDALVDVRCYDLVSLFLCSLFVPKCGPTGTTVPPCKTLCVETMRRCGFFFDVFGLELPEYLTCGLFTDTSNPDECVGLKQVRDARIQAQKPVCSGFLCDQKRCIPSDWRCDGHVDCLDQADESQCDFCGKGSIYCGNNKCMSQKHICDGHDDCPWGQDERNCIRLSERNGDLGKGTLEVYKADIKLWAPACVTQWDSSTSPSKVCTMLGYSSVNSSKLTIRGSNMTMSVPNRDPSSMWRMSPKRPINPLKEFSSCSVNEPYPVVELTCTNFECGKIRNRQKRQPKTRIVGGIESSPGDWPFLAAILGGPEEIFYCAGVLIADQWVLTASHCIGNHTLRNINDWTIQLGITRRHSHSYYGQKVKVRNVIPHPQYNSYVAHDNDIALFQLATRVAFHEHLLPVCLPPQGLRELKPGTLCTVIGWGKREDKNLNPTAASASYEPTVNQVQVPVLNRDLCNEWLETLNVTDGMICAGYQEGGKDACQGDSGGPLLCRDPADKERWFVGGIVSWGIMCAHPKLPGVYANVPKYIPWITQQINRYSKSNFDNNMGY